jgi:hypothetical protein
MKTEQEWRDREENLYLAGLSMNIRKKYGRAEAERIARETAKKIVNREKGEGK